MAKSMTSCTHMCGKKQYYVYSHCWGGGKDTYIQHNFSGTRRACVRFIKNRGNHGFYFITTISSYDKVVARYGR